MKVAGTSNAQDLRPVRHPNPFKQSPASTATHKPRSSPPPARAGSFIDPKPSFRSSKGNCKKGWITFAVWVVVCTFTRSDCNNHRQLQAGQCRWKRIRRRTADGRRSGKSCHFSVGIYSCRPNGECWHAKWGCRLKQESWTIRFCIKSTSRRSFMKLVALSAAALVAMTSAASAASPIKVWVTP